MNKPYSESCEQNREPIEQVLAQFVADRRDVLEIGSGTGQHAVYFGARFPQLRWQTSDLKQNHQGIRAWIEDSDLNNVLQPIELEACGDWPVRRYDMLYSANTLHIMSAKSVRCLFGKIAHCMCNDAVFLLYGPFNYHGRYTSDSNGRFDQWLKQRDPDSGLRDFDWIEEIAAQSGLECAHDFTMPANNRLLVWRKNEIAVV